MRRLSQRLRLSLPWVGILLALTGILLIKSCSSAQPVSNLNPPAVVQPESSPFPSGTQPPPEPQSLPETQPSFDPNSGFPPETSAQILNASEIDGISLTVGQSITLQGSSAAIEWRDSTGRVLGQGSQLVYQAQDVRMETITARIGQAAQSRVSFTVSSPDVVVAPHVKVIPDDIAALEDNGILTLPMNEMIPTLLVGDVVVGTEVPPLKIFSLQQRDSEWVLGVQPALPKELIESGTATFEQEVDWSGESGEVVLVDIPSEPFHIADGLDPKWEGFVQAGDPIDRGLKVTARASLNWKPTYSGSITFDKNVAEGLAHFIIQQSSPVSVQYSQVMDGTQFSRTNDFELVPLRDISIFEFTKYLGPIPVTAKISNETLVLTDYNLDVVNSMELNLDFQIGSFIEESKCDLIDEIPCQQNVAIKNESIGIDLADDSDIQGNFEFVAYSLRSFEVFKRKTSFSGLIFHSFLGASRKVDFSPLLQTNPYLLRDSDVRTEIVAGSYGGINYTTKSMNDVIQLRQSQRILTRMIGNRDLRSIFRQSSLQALPQAIRQCLSQPDPRTRLACLQQLKAACQAGVFPQNPTSPQLEVLDNRIATQEAINQLLEGSVDVSDSSVPNNFSKPGGLNAANMEFSTMPGLTNIMPITTSRFGPGQVGTLPDGSTVSIRPSATSTPAPTIQINTPDGRGGTIEIKVRFDAP